MTSYDCSARLAHVIKVLGDISDSLACTYTGEAKSDLRELITKVRGYSKDDARWEAVAVTLEDALNHLYGSELMEGGHHLVSLRRALSDNGLPGISGATPRP